MFTTRVETPFFNYRKTHWRRKRDSNISTESKSLAALALKRNQMPYAGLYIWRRIVPLLSCRSLILSL